LTNDISYGRTKDGALPWIKFTATTPGYSNSGTSGIFNPDDQNKIQFYPSPASDHLWIDIPAEAGEILEVKVTDISGRTLKLWDQTDLEGNVRTKLYWGFGNLNEPDDGIYLLTVKSKNGLWTSKFLISRN
jgi:hypothetical protein